MAEFPNSKANLLVNLFFFRQKHFSGLKQRILDYIFISNSLQESVLRTGILGRFLSDHSPVAVKISIFKEL